ncbi:MAG: hypothetical protein U9M97_04585, partial [Candidatus Hadarchaeota archaeon]|nr:hypothetical protein [Candidatus Hadarchaeota archaeon]
SKKRCLGFWIKNKINAARSQDRCWGSYRNPARKPPVSTEGMNRRILSETSPQKAYRLVR